MLDQQLRCLPRQYWIASAILRVFTYLHRLHDGPAQQFLLLQPRRVPGAGSRDDKLRDVWGTPPTTPATVTPAAPNATPSSPAAAVTSATSTPTLPGAAAVGASAAARSSAASLAAAGAGIDLLPCDQCHRRDQCQPWVLHR